MEHDVIVVGGGISGLTATAYLARAGYATLLCEKEHTCGGLVNAFERGGFHFDGGIRAIENSGMVFPMLRDLGIELEFLPSQVTLGIEDHNIPMVSAEDLTDYQALLEDLFPESRHELPGLVAQMRQSMGYMDILYGVDNPIFMDVKKDAAYFGKVVLPWLPKFVLTLRRIAKSHDPIGDKVRQYTQNQSLIDVIIQHFFRDTPAFFALGYFSLYLDYRYPRGGTAKLPQSLVRYISDHGGQIRTDTRIVAVDPQARSVTDADGQQHGYRSLIWAADLKALYRCLEIERIEDATARQAVVERKAALENCAGGDSVLTLFLGVDLDKSYFEERTSAHLFYTPHRIGQSQAGPAPIGQGRQAIERWLTEFLRLTTYEISIPVLRDPALAPPGQTGLIISLLFDYDLTVHIQEAGWYDAFKVYCESRILEVLDASVFPGIKDAVVERFSSTPLSIARTAGTTDGAITGWAFTNTPVPAEHRLPRVASAVRTPIPGVLQAGQWTFSPSGLPTCILTGKLAADAAAKAVKKAAGRR